MVKHSAFVLVLAFALAQSAVAADPVSPAAATGAASAPPATVVAPDTLYYCVKDSGGVHTQTPIEFAPNVYNLCTKHPEMGPCQYARAECRRGGGRVYAADGTEITMKTEAEYDKKVIRATIR
jgi:hypothetical protein